MAKHTDEQIKKDLKLLSEYSGLNDKFRYALKCSLDLINRQEAEIERLKRDGLTEAHYKALYGAAYALADMVFQFGYSTTFRNKDAVCDGGLSALENAFGALLNCGCRTNSNGTISIKNLLEFQSEFEAKMVGESK